MSNTTVPPQGTLDDYSALLAGVESADDPVQRKVFTDYLEENGENEASLRERVLQNPNDRTSVIAFLCWAENRSQDKLGAIIVLLRALLAQPASKALDYRNREAIERNIFGYPQLLSDADVRRMRDGIPETDSPLHGLLATALVLL
jgi:hypothetical protein